MKRAPWALAWIIPPLVCLALYWPGLRAWFQADDFAWLSLSLDVHNGADLLKALFVPKAGGSTRVLSERAFFLAFHAMFGLDALPYRIWVFATQFANLWLLAAIARRITGSDLAGLLAPLFWIVNGTLAVIMTWTSAYNQVLWAFFTLLSFWFLLRFVETSARKYELAQWVSFLLGFGALELNVVYPALAAVYVFFQARSYFRRTLWLFVPAIAFAVVQRSLAPRAIGRYTLHFDFGMARTLWTYWTWALGFGHLAELEFVNAWVVPAGLAVLTAALLGYVAWKAYRRNWLPLVLLSWFILALAPVLPLRDHPTEYYPAVPSIGLATLGAMAVAEALRNRTRWKLAAVILAVVYIWPSAVVASDTTRWLSRTSLDIKQMVLGVARAHQLHPGKTILLTGVNSNLFWRTFMDNPFRVVGWTQVFLAPGSEDKIERHPEIADVMDFVLPAASTLKGLERDQVVVYSAEHTRLRNITPVYKALARLQLKPEPPVRVDVGNPLMADFLGPTWYPLENGYRWMPRRATIRMAGPRKPGQKLHITGYCSADQIRLGPVSIAVTADDKPLPVVACQTVGRFDFDLPLPSELSGKREMVITVEAGRTITPPAEGREIGLAFGVFEVR
jgi:hypothetical protein